MAPLCHPFILLPRRLSFCFSLSRSFNSLSLALLLFCVLLFCFPKPAVYFVPRRTTRWLLERTVRLFVRPETLRPPTLLTIASREATLPSSIARVPVPYFRLWFCIRRAIVRLVCTLNFAIPIAVPSVTPLALFVRWCACALCLFLPIGLAKVGLTREANREPFIRHSFLCSFFLSWRKNSRCLFLRTEKGGGCIGRI